jgi:galactokinase
MTIHVRAPGRVNLIGEHTDYTGGLVLPMTIDRWTEIRCDPSDMVSLRSDDDPNPTVLDLHIEDLAAVQPQWAKYVAGVVAEMRPSKGIAGTVSTNIPIGAGLSSSAALEVAVALALGYSGDAVGLAELCRRAEINASGVPCGIMDQLTVAAGVAGHALLIDCGDLTIEPVKLPEGVEIVVQFIAHRTLVGSAYADRVAECAEAERLIGPLRVAGRDDVMSIPDAIVRARALHVVEENERARDFASALRSEDLAAAGELVIAGHASLRDLYQVSTPVMDAAVERMIRQPGVFGARMTGGGFGGCIVALTEPGAITDGWVVRAVDGAARVE